MAFFHNLGMVLFVVLIAHSGSSENQIILSIVAIVYWLSGFVMIYKRNKQITITSLTKVESALTVDFDFFPSDNEYWCYGKKA